MRWFKKHLWNVGIASVGVLFLLTCLALIPLSAASAHEGTSRVATPSAVAVQATPTVDATVTALSKEQLTQEVAQQQHTWSNWLWGNAATLSSTLVIVIGALFGLWRWRRERQDAQDKELKERRDAQNKELKERQNELKKRAEERFQAAVSGLGDDKEGARIGAAILLRTFLRPGYEQFYAQTFDLAVANLRLPRTAHLPEENPDALHTPPQADPNTPAPLTTLSQALITVFKESFPLAHDNSRSSNTGEEALQSLDATGIQLDHAYLRKADLKHVWMPQASLHNAKLYEANLQGANLRESHLNDADLNLANLSGTDLRQANFSGATLCGANLNQALLMEANFSDANLLEIYIITINSINPPPTKTNLSQAFLMQANFHKAALIRADLSAANLSNANFSDADLSYADLSQASLYYANPEDALSLKNTNLHGVQGLTIEQLAACKAKGAIIDEDLTTSAFQPIVASPSPPQSNDAQAASTPSAQRNTPPSDPDESNAVSSQPDPKS
jgi:uncharacterized protein YjbI with pentapeptide repeats